MNPALLIAAGAVLTTLTAIFTYAIVSTIKDKEADAQEAINQEFIKVLANENTRASMNNKELRDRIEQLEENSDSYEADFLMINDIASKYMMPVEIDMSK